MAVDEARVLALVERDDYEPLTVKGMARRLQVVEDDYAAFRNLLKSLVKDGKLDIARNKTLSKPTGKGRILGTFRRTSKGFGFVRPAKVTDRSQDIYIPAGETLDASNGDEVSVRIVKRSHLPGQNSEGRIIKVVSRSSGLFVGTYYEDLGTGYVKIDGTAFRDPVAVGDPGAKGAKPGDKVALEMVRYPTPFTEGEGVITELIGPRGQPGVDTLSIIRALGIPDVFDDEVLEDARDQAKQFDETKLEGREDLRDVLTVTIDPATARDFDDAITLTRDDKGYWSLGVHIADVSHFVRPGSYLDRSAQKRGNSVYLPDRVIPMLPEILSNSLASLQQGHVRFTMSVFIEFDPSGVRTDRRFARSAINVDKRFAYERAFEVMSHPEQVHEGVTPEVQAMLGQMLTLARILRVRRFDRGALELSMPEVEVELGNQGEVVGAHLASNDESHQVIEEFMLAANEAVASYLNEQKAAILRRSHADPDVAKLRQFAEFARSLGFEIDKPQSRFELQRLLKEAAERPEAHAVHYGLLRSLKQAVYTPEIEGHYALASDDYCHFTSPIRRYPDLQVHRQLGAILDGKRPRSDLDELASLAEHCNKTERRAELAEREIIRVKLLTYLADKIGQEFTAVIIGAEDFGLFCQLVEFPVEGLIHVTALADDYYYLESDTHTLVGRRSGNRHRLGDRVSVRVARVDIDRRELDLVFADALHPELDLPINRAQRPRSTSRSAEPRPATAARGPERRAPKGRKPKAKPARTPKGKKKKRKK